jgi:flagellar basal body-associated protein FliL
MLCNIAEERISQGRSVYEIKIITSAFNKQLATRKTEMCLSSFKNPLHLAALTRDFMVNILTENRTLYLKLGIG